ncbi:MAG: response regulator [Defluviitaleaceae bacterium]|nr:response regulator [Defluviitaleaceae bacterium]
MDKTIFVVDDIGANLFAAEEALEEYYNVITAPSAKRAIELLEKVVPQLILMDVDMPEMDGFEALKYLKSKERFKDIPVVMLTGMSDMETEVKGFEMGAWDFIAKPFSAPVLLNRVKMHIGISELIKERTDMLKDMFKNRIYVLTDIVERRDKLTGGHVEYAAAQHSATERSAEIIKILVTALQQQKVYYENVKDWDPDSIASSSLLHDIGKITITDSILSKPEDLSPEEFEIMKTHTEAGERIINQIIERDDESEFLYFAKLFAKYHHERWDGEGYPLGLKGEDIPLEGRIMAVVDAYDALISGKNREVMTVDEAFIEIAEGSGTQFDPKIVEVFCKARDQIKEVSRV